MKFLNLLLKSFQELFDVSNSFYINSTVLTKEEAVQTNKQALYSDWQVVGQDMYQSILKIHNKTNI